MENNLELKRIDINNVSDLQLFINTAGNSLQTFRYFEKRNLDIINNHILTLLLYNDSKPVAYGHLEEENNKVWLGICVSENNKKKGFGKSIINELITYAKNKNISKIHLTVDSDNQSAIKLYKKKGFVNIDSHKKNVCLMVLEIK